MNADLFRNGDFEKIVFDEEDVGFVRDFLDAKMGDLRPQITKVKFEGPTTKIRWTDGSTTSVTCAMGDKFDAEKGILLCIAKKYYGNRDGFYNKFSKYVPKPPKPEKKEEKTKTMSREELKELLGLLF